MYIDELILLWRMFLLHRNQSIDLQSKSMDWFLYDRDLCHERVKRLNKQLKNIWTWIFSYIMLTISYTNFVSIEYVTSAV